MLLASRFHRHAQCLVRGHGEVATQFHPQFDPHVVECPGRGWFQSCLLRHSTLFCASSRHRRRPTVGHPLRGGFQRWLGRERYSFSHQFPVAPPNASARCATAELTHPVPRLQFRLAARNSQASQSRIRFASARAWRACCRAASSCWGMWSPFWKYISSGVCPWKAECGSRALCSWT